jgi:hypothetical protein
MWDLWWTKWHGAGFLRVLLFPLPIFIPRLPHSHHNLSPGAGTIGQWWVAVPSELSLTPHQETILNYIFYFYSTVKIIFVVFETKVVVHCFPVLNTHPTILTHIALRKLGILHNWRNSSRSNSHNYSSTSPSFDRNISLITWFRNIC